MSNLIEEKLKSSVRTSLNNKTKDHKLRTALDYLNQISFTVDGTSNKTIDLLFNDAICLLGNSRMTNLMLTRLTVHCLMPKKYGGFRISKAFILDAGNCTDVYQFVDFARQYGLEVKKVLQNMVVSRVFTIYHLSDLILHELPKIVDRLSSTNKIIVVNGLLHLFLSDSHIDKIDTKIS